MDRTGLKTDHPSILLGGQKNSNRPWSMEFRVPPAEIAGIISGAICVVVFASVVAILCWRFPSCRSRHFWDKNIKRALRKVYGKCRRRKEKEERKSLIVGPALRKRSRDEAPFVVPQIFVDYGSRRTSYASASDHVMLGALALDLRRASNSSGGSRRTSIASDSDRRGSASSLGSRRTSFASDTDRRGSASSVGSRRTSIFSDPSDRRGSASSRSSRKNSDGSRIDDTDVSFADFSDSETVEVDDARVLGPRVSRRTSYEIAGRVKEVPPPYRRSHSLAELQGGEHTPPPGAERRATRVGERRSTLSSLVFSSINAMEQTGGNYTPANAKGKKHKV
ncbi:EF-hand calcium-binding domain-containing protein 5-like [Littorina saxatilis]|uniref:EF-hand calcium-binding domain-containing protein 5-like n=1 Tax=Littorina saxatilis TaxID=31220 RepID=UPI0038B59253